MYLVSIIQKVLIASLVIMAITYMTKDTLPSPEYYGMNIPSPIQTKTDQKPFKTEIGGEHYKITPLYHYTLEGIVVSMHRSDDFLDMAHDEWKDYMNVADICVIWGENVTSGIYEKMSFSNGNWTCYYSWSDPIVGQHFSQNLLSNNHLLTDDPLLKREILAIHPGDHIRISGMLVNYTNITNGVTRKTSTVRTDRGQGACEIIYVKELTFVQKANTLQQTLYWIAKHLFFFLLPLWIVLYFTSGRHHAQQDTSF